MIVRIRLKHGPVPRKRAQQERETLPGVQAARADRVTVAELLSGVSAFLQPASAILFALALWRLGADLGLAGKFMFADGLLSHWQVWFAGAAAVQGVSWLLNRKAGDSGDKESAA